MRVFEISRPSGRALELVIYTCESCYCYHLDNVFLLNGSIIFRSLRMAKFVKFTKLRSSTDSTFWAKFVELKIDKFKLDEKSVNLWGNYNLQSLNEDNTNPLVLDFTSFNEYVYVCDIIYYFDHCISNIFQS